MNQDIEDECAVLHALRLIGRKWMVFILSELVMSVDNDGLFFSELLSRIQDKYGKKISARVLSDSLTVLEDEGIINRKIIQDKQVRVQYSLSEKGYDLVVIFGASKGWGIKWGGELKHKKCRSFTCVHNAVPALDIERAKDLLYSENQQKSVQ
ncbi:MAG: winged helix-turn-helix transcriptional regulator [Candidatus Odinarchaeota archaeon]